MIRLGLCCIFKEQPIKFRRTTARYLSGLSRTAQKEKLAGICRENASSLMQALIFCHENAIGSFRINSQILPMKTHPEAGYDIEALPDSDRIIQQFKACGDFARKQHIRTTFHPDQFIVLSSPDPGVVERSIADLEYHAQVAQWVNADVINIHAGGVYGDRRAALQRLAKVVDSLSEPLRQRLTLENDDRSYSPADLIDFCMQMQMGLVYDVHHHRCLKDGLSVEDATQRCAGTWGREPLFHISSPRNGWQAQDIHQHHDYIDINDVPESWYGMEITVEVEAKAKELAVLKLMKEMSRPGKL